MPDLILGDDWLCPVHHAPGHAFGADTAHASIVGILSRQAARYGEAPFLTDLTAEHGRTFGWAGAHAEVARRSALLAKWGIGRGDRVAILGPNSADFVFAVLSVLEAGGVAVLLNFRDPATRIAARVEFTGARVLLYDAGSGSTAESCQTVERICCFEEFRAGSAVEQDAAPAPMGKASDGALVFFTSGTTGMPKAVVQSHYAVAQNAWSLVQHHGIEPGLRLLCVLPLHHVNGLEFTIFASLLGGGHTFLTRGFDPLNFGAVVEKQGIHIVSLIPNLLRLLAGRPGLLRGCGPQIRYAVSAAAPLSTAAASEVWHRLGLRIVQGYGLSEVTNFSCLMPVAMSDAEYGNWMLDGRHASIGPVLPGQEVRVLRESRLAGPEEQGEIVIRGHCVMSGYLNNQSATDRAFEGGWFHTGDVGYFLPDGDGRKFFHIAGRIREIAKRSGAMVNLSELDEILSAIPGVADVVSVAFRNKWVDEEIGAVVVRQEGSRIDQNEILTHCRAALSFAEAPKVIRFVDEVPRTATGKAQRAEAARLFDDLEETAFPDIHIKASTHSGE